MPVKFSFLHISDFHLCLEPKRSNIFSLARRRPNLNLDTCVQQIANYGFLSYAKPASYSPQIISATAQFCYAHKNVSDGIIITGDLATTGSQLDIAAARDYALAAPANGFLSQTHRPTLSASRLPLWVIPGNHDKYADNLATPKGRNFELTFAGVMPNYKNGVGHKVRRKSGAFLGILFADFCLRDRGDATNKITGPYGQGKVYTDVLHELEGRSRDLRRKYPGITLIWCIHFAPYDCGSILALLDWQLVSKSALMNNILLTLCGHTHVPSVFKLGTHTTYCAGSAGAVDQEESSAVHIVDVIIDENPTVSRNNFRWDRSSGQYVHSHFD